VPRGGAMSSTKQQARGFRWVVGSDGVAPDRQRFLNLMPRQGSRSSIGCPDVVFRA
jgi:hypothetical protein